MGKRKNRSISELPGIDSPIVHEPRERELRWLAAHPEVLTEHLGEWIAVEGEEIVAAGKRLIDVLAAARTRGMARPLTLFVPADPRDYSSGLSNQPAD